MKLHSLKNAEGAKKSSRRVGRGDSSGYGRTCGRGEKGQSSRSGSSRRLHFEGGQIPLFRRLPKRGFKSRNHKDYTVVNLRDLEEVFNANDVVDTEILLEKKVIPKLKYGLKILGSGEITKPLTIKADHFSETAKNKIEAIGGKCELNQ
jgi:large subunit ribosomal protein L15